MEFNRFDTSAKELVWDDPVNWLERFGIGPSGPVEIIDSDITALTASPDKVLKVGGPRPISLAHHCPQHLIERHGGEGAGVI